MAKTYFNEQQIKKWFVSEQSAKKVYHDDKLVFSGRFELVIASSNHNVPANWIWSLLPADQQAAQGNTIIIKVNPGVELVTASTTINGVFDFSGSWAGKIVVIENSGIILGRGGRGGNEAVSGDAGGRAIYTDGTATVNIINNGIIGGGGGGGGGNRRGDSCGGGGGAPLGGGGWGSYFGWAGAATFNTPGAGGGNNLANPGAGQTRWGGNGATWGNKGSPGMDFGYVTTSGGAAGEATRGTITWINRGDIRGATV